MVILCSNGVMASVCCQFSRHRNYQKSRQNSIEGEGKRDTAGEVAVLHTVVPWCGEKRAALDAVCAHQWNMDRIPNNTSLYKDIHHIVGEGSDKTGALLR